jgi:CheY-like chemotaxis protein
MKSILYAEDREDDVFFLRRACRRAGFDGVLQIHSVNDGQLAVDYLVGTGDYADRTKFPLPDLVLLDLKMPRRSGLEVLEWIRGQPGMIELPVFLLTSSNQQADIDRASALGANGYFIKPGGIGELATMVEQLAIAVGVRLPTAAGATTAASISG